MSKLRLRSRISLAFVAMAMMMFALVPAGPASAGAVQGAFVGTATLTGGIGVCPSNGTASFPVVAGTHGGAPATGSASAAFSYCNSDVVAGTANGTLTVTANGLTHTCGFAWVRTGLTAAVTLSGGCSGSATAVFGPAGNTAVVSGVATFSH